MSGKVPPFTLTDERLAIEARFTRDARDLGYVVLEPNDLFVEFYYYEHWFNIFQIFSAGGTLKGWYCNIGRPPAVEPGEIHYVDLALDLFVYPELVASWFWMRTNSRRSARTLTSKPISTALFAGWRSFRCGRVRQATRSQLD